MVTASDSRGSCHSRSGCHLILVGGRHSVDTLFFMLKQVRTKIIDSRREIVQVETSSQTGGGELVAAAGVVLATSMNPNWGGEVLQVGLSPKGVGG